MALVRHNLLLTMNCKCVVPENIPTFSLEDSPTPLEIDHICTPGIRLELACNGGSCGRISLKREKCHLHLKRLPALASIAS